MDEKMKKLIPLAERILRGIGVEPEKDFIDDIRVINMVATKPVVVHGTKIKEEIVLFEKGTCRVDIDFSLPEDGVLAKAFMDHCAAIEKTPKNHGHEYCAGPQYKSWSDELGKKTTFALSPWNNKFFYVRSEHYLVSELEEAVDNAIALARRFASHLADLPSLRYWKDTDEEVVAKAKEIVENAAFEETDIDREDRSHWLEDRNSFFRGWFFPLRNDGKGAFDTFPYPLHGTIGIEGSFEYAVSCVLLYDKDYIAKAKKACRIRTETRTVRY